MSAEAIGTDVFSDTSDAGESAISIIPLPAGFSGNITTWPILWPVGSTRNSLLFGGGYVILAAGVEVTSFKVRPGEGVRVKSCSGE